MQRIIGSIFLIVVMSSFVIGSSIIVGFTIKDNQLSNQNFYKSTEFSFDNYGLYSTGLLLILIGGFFLFKSKVTNQKKKLSKKKIIVKNKKTNSKKQS